MNEIIDFTIDKNLRSNPEEIADMITSLAEDIELTKGNLVEIKDRKWYQRIFADNTSDLAESMIAQNDTISTFLTIVQYLLVLNMNNIVVLGGIIDKINEQEEARGISGNKYINMAKDFLQESITAAQKTKSKFSEHETKIEEIAARIIRKGQLLEKQQYLINQLEDDLVTQKHLDEEHTKKIRKLAFKLTQIENIDKNHDEKIKEILEILNEQDRIDQLHTKEIEEIKEYIGNTQTYIQEFEEKVSKNKLEFTLLGEEQSKVNKKLILFSVFNLVISLGAVILAILL
jgi:ribosomal protein S13